MHRLSVVGVKTVKTKACACMHVRPAPNRSQPPPRAAPRAAEEGGPKCAFQSARTWEGSRSDIIQTRKLRELAFFFNAGAWEGSRSSVLLSDTFQAPAFSKRWRVGGVAHSRPSRPPCVDAQSVIHLCEPGGAGGRNGPRIPVPSPLPHALESG